MIKASRAVVSLVMVTGMWGLGMGPATSDTAAAAAVSDDPTVVRLLGGGVLQAATPDDTSTVTVSDDLVADAVDVRDQLHPMVAVAPCQLDHGTFDRVVCPADQVSSIVVLTGLGDDAVFTMTTEPVVVATGAGNDAAIDSVSQDAHFLMGPGFDAVRPGSGANDVVGGPGEDQVSYRDNVGPTLVALDDVANDGTALHDDNIHSDVEDIFGGMGDDVLMGSADANVLDGGPGDDQLVGRGDDDMFATIFDFNQPTGADEMIGNFGIDTVSYAGRQAGGVGVVLRLDGVANDGQPGEHDNVHADVENVIGTTADDVLTGSSAGNQLIGLEGNDLLGGGLGADLIDGGDGTDSVTYAGRANAVTVRLDGTNNDGQPGEGDNVLATENVTGGDGNDLLVGDAGPNLLRGLLGNDRLLGRAGNDTLTGDQGTDFGDGGTGVDSCRTETRVRCP